MTDNNNTGVDPHIIAIIGLPGSGRTAMAREIQKQIEWFLLFDDIEKSKQTWELFLYSLKNKESCIIIDANLCMITARVKMLKLLSKYGYKNVQMIFFENKPTLCVNNIDPKQYHDINTVLDMTKKYHIPKYETNIKQIVNKNLFS